MEMEENMRWRAYRREESWILFLAGMYLKVEERRGSKVEGTRKFLPSRTALMDGPWREFDEHCNVLCEA
jgi:hypothetical protein